MLTVLVYLSLGIIGLYAAVRVSAMAFFEAKYDYHCKIVSLTKGANDGKSRRS